MYEINRMACTQSMLDHQPRSQSFEIGSAMGTSLPAYVLLLLSFFFFTKMEVLSAFHVVA